MKLEIHRVIFGLKFMYHTDLDVGPSWWLSTPNKSKA